MIKDIYNWLEVAGVSQEGTPQQFDLWKRLMEEELDEMDQAFKDKNKDEMLDAFVDLIVVNTNMPFMMGYSLEDIQDRVNRVLKSNWSKYCDNEEDALVSVNLYREGNHPTKPGEKIKAYYEKVGEWYIIKRLPDNKILKSHLYKAP